ncbi:MAG: hypothetical protein ACD_52C00031G0002 [uncultured bacterium]|uniref:Uncharacterized protein n=1 Tax=Candidatus Woesebacteria bacterium RIFCSPHIGHO2_12_FULL_41_24 TaxID=1802510 RepID=A0A1F8ATM9_9BACT|nr:MAG: hypothetical protein ACD_52C00031G0002 [uncultured bacterium]OGM15063.1 MAG: hypothetical protein A2W15_04530 [Candidatus Woesebacteria bacterium RBG_16_41_13]OGM28985.1 MAG: hypothetical protein A2873_01535 [Candidatus Woesebacteria bacterium RIFCSPHIGHO2_01_FULL_42_80]OGM35143.1 MAG: hypothetical protein A3D84_02250 [Candidatus Woesebacteria bacterium RIFCSPHIGHO2_02_FULL_42_20]OGM54879.1 MAG: hypothetical protein A3E44_01850 [Candidatus Woesebacteria bacterium RIFCSPHIGHO2_12_FULL_41
MDTKKKHALVIILLWLFAPAAWVLMVRDKRYWSWLPTLLIINGIVFTLIALYLNKFLFLLFATLQIPYGLFLQKNSTYLKANLAVIIVIFTLDLLFGLGTISTLFDISRLLY